MYSFTRVAIKATVFLGIGICDHLGPGVKFRSNSNFHGQQLLIYYLLLTSVTKTELMLWGQIHKRS